MVVVDATTAMDVVHSAVINATEVDTKINSLVVIAMAEVNLTVKPAAGSVLCLVATVKAQGK